MVQWHQERSTGQRTLAYCSALLANSILLYILQNEWKPWHDIQGSSRGEQSTAATVLTDSSWRREWKRPETISDYVHHDNTAEEKRCLNPATRLEHVHTTLLVNADDSYPLLPHEPSRGLRIRAKVAQIADGQDPAAAQVPYCV